MGLAQDRLERLLGEPLPEINVNEYPEHNAAGTADAAAEPTDRDLLHVGWLRGHDLNVRPSGYEPDELPGCSTPRWYTLLSI